MKIDSVSSMIQSNMTDLEKVVALVGSENAYYGNLNKPIAAPELPLGIAKDTATAAIRSLFFAWGLDRQNYGKKQWNPLGIFIHPGDKVVMKPNWVSDVNKSGSGIECLVTHGSIIKAVLEYVAIARPGQVIIGDAPLQSCNFEQLMDLSGISSILSDFQARKVDVAIADFRRTIMQTHVTGIRRLNDQSDMSNFVLFDLKEHSLLEELNADSEKFRVTMYDPEQLKKTHRPGRHQYLIAREVVDADVVINLPKLKTHKKACITGALKNLVGINGHKEYLPHHRKGGDLTGGDCYPGGSKLKLYAEQILDLANKTDGVTQKILFHLQCLLIRCAKLLGDSIEIEGSWHGNDTVWRTVLDLQRILRYGKVDGTLADEPQRIVVSITDAIIGGEGEGPLSPHPVPSGFVTGAVNPAAAEWVNARLMGFDPQRIPVTREAFADFPYPLVSFSSASVRVHHAQDTIGASEVFPLENRSFRPSKGWHGHCELDL